MSDTYITAEVPQWPRKYDNIYYIRGDGTIVHTGKVNEVLGHLGNGHFKVTVRIPFTVAVDTIYLDQKLGKWMILDPEEPKTTK